MRSFFHRAFNFFVFLLTIVASLGDSSRVGRMVS